ncbi:AraC family transcriptional regulator [Pseudogulbenkiania sp. MAI-1]|uniref:AraC family transcriptional regulator n=1 Tax=Pseudogulbenkiania sp. MAI-1 TaxID=990370 RepID=UPI00045E5991|nr:AraC family transcriptional regulator [Pseudogulbenkiania sp. MAI-1]
MNPSLSVRHYLPETQAHSHDHAQLVFGLDGALQMDVEGRAGCVAAQQLAVIPSACRHAFAGAQAASCLVLDVSSGVDGLGALLGAGADEARRLLDTPGTHVLSPALASLVSGLAALPTLDAAVGRHGAALLLAGLVQQPAATLPGLPLARIDAFIDRHCAHPLQVRDLAELVGLAPSRFHERFLAETGLRPMEYVRRRRLRLARLLLTTTMLPVGEVAARTGYSSQSAFTSALVREFGETPSALRRAARAESRTKPA